MLDQFNIKGVDEDVGKRLRDVRLCLILNLLAEEKKIRKD